MILSHLLYNGKFCTINFNVSWILPCELILLKFRNVCLLFELWYRIERNGTNLDTKQNLCCRLTVDLKTTRSCGGIQILWCIKVKVKLRICYCNRVISGTKSYDIHGEKFWILHCYILLIQCLVFIWLPVSPGTPITVSVMPMKCLLEYQFCPYSNLYV